MLVWCFQLSVLLIIPFDSFHVQCIPMLFSFWTRNMTEESELLQLFAKACGIMQTMTIKNIYYIKSDRWDYK